MRIHLSVMGTIRIALVAGIALAASAWNGVDTLAQTLSPEKLPSPHFIGGDQPSLTSANQVRVRVADYFPVHTNLVRYELVLSAENQYEEISRPLYEQEMQWARSIFRTSSAGGGGYGTSFLIDRSVVLTNAHVLSLPPHQPGKPYPFTSHTVSCRKFAIQFQGEWIPCTRVLYCHTPFHSLRDFCVVQVGLTRSGKFVGDLVPPLEPDLSTPNVRGAPYVLIGNIDDQGIQASWGHLLGALFYTEPNQPKEQWAKKPTIYTFSDLISTGGASGSPIVNPRNGRVIGLNYGRIFQGRTNPPFIFKFARVTALPLESIKAELRAMMSPELHFYLPHFLGYGSPVIRNWITKQNQRKN